MATDLMTQEDRDLATEFERLPEGNLPAAAGLGGAVQLEQHVPLGAQQVAVRRDMAHVLRSIKVLATAGSTTFFYRFPVKNKGRVSYIEGPTVKLANAIARTYGNCAVDVRIVDQPKTFLIYARFVDLESGFSMVRAFQQDKGASRLGGSGPEADARRLDIALQIGMSKAIRNVIVNALPIECGLALEVAMKNLVERIGKNVEQYRERALAWFKSRQVDVRRVEATAGKPAKDWQAHDLARITAEVKAVEDGMSTVDDTWPPLEPGTAPPQQEPTDTVDGDGVVVEPGEAATGDGRPAKNWTIGEGVVGMENRLKAVLDLLDMTESTAEVDELERTHAALIEKAGRQRSSVLAAFRARRTELAQGGH